VAIALVFLVGAAALSLTLPILLGKAADSGRQAGGDPQKLLELVDRSFFWVAAAAIASGVLGAVRFYFVSRFGERIAADLRRGPLRPLADPRAALPFENALR
jgi:ATP-binding cassette subfamily B protein